MSPFASSARHALLLVASAAAFAFAATAPAGANFVATGEDPAGDAADPHPGRDIVRASFAYDRRTGAVRGGVRLRGVPESAFPSNLTLLAGTRTATGCTGYPALGFATQTDLRAASWIRLDAGGGKVAASGSAVKTYDGAIEEYSATPAALKGRRPDCVIAQLNDPANPAAVHDVAGPFALKGLPELEARLTGVPTRLRPGSTRTVRFVVRNPGDGRSGKLRIKVRGARGLQVRYARSAPSIAAGGRRTVPLKVTLSKRSKLHTTLDVTATDAGGLRAQAEDNLFRSSRTSGSSGSGGKDGTKLCYRYHWQPPYSKLEPC